MRICVLIPCHNEAKAIGGLVEQLKVRSLDVVVVNDGSTDETSRIARTNGAHVIDIPVCGGKGNAMQKGFDHILSQGYDALIVMDGDGQHAVEDVQKFIDRFKFTASSVINGNRMEDRRDMPLIRRVTNHFMSWLISVVCGQPVPDSQCGFRLISCSVLRNIKLTSTNFEIESEILIKACRAGFKVDSVPIQTIYKDEVSKIRPVRDTIRFIKYILRELFSREL